SIARSWRSRTAKGKSIIFLFVVIVGYVAGIIHKVFYNWDKVILLYIINLTMVSIDAAIYYRNKSLDKLKDTGSL
ncbi:MAG: hypothetical protein JNL74_22645, partial [Fibrobacteres bacterium]|nr:hypothetical protein [Fibrobacterota bacterium]